MHAFNALIQILGQAYAYMYLFSEGQDMIRVNPTRLMKILKSRTLKNNFL